MGNCQDNTCKSYLEQHNLITNTQVNVIDQIHNEFIVLPENENQYDPLYGYIDILEFKDQNKSGFKLVHKTHMFYDIDKYKRALKFYETRFHGMNHPNLLIIHAIQNKQIDQFFNSEYKISLFLDYPIRSFQQEILYRKKMYFDESEILYFMDSVIGALAFLQSKGVPYKNVRLENIHLVQLLNGNLGIKLQFPEINQKSFMHELLNIVSQDQRFDYQHYPYLSPEQLSILRNKKMEQYDEFKSDVFTLGLIILELCTVRKSIYIYEEFQIDQLLLNDQIVKLEDKYSEQIGLILKSMLQFDPRVRQDFIDLDDLLNSSSLKGKRIAQNWTIEDYQYCVNDQPKKVHFQTKQLSLLHPELISQMSNQSNFKQENVKGSHLSIKQVLSKNSKESRASSSNVRGKEQYSPGRHNALFKKYDTELASKGGSKKLIQTTDGFGIECDANGLTYEGNYQAGKRYGEGKLLNDENEVIYEGNFQDNLFHKYGSLKNTEKIVLSEPFNYKDFNSLGKYWSRYDGVFQMGQKHGHGQLVLTNTERFVGQFENDMLNGPGTFHTLVIQILITRMELQFRGNGDQTSSFDQYINSMFLQGLTQIKLQNRLEQLEQRMNITPLGKVQQIVAVEIIADNKQSKESCQICKNPLAILKKGDQVVMLPCKDTFHAGCLKQIIQHKAIKCPNCSTQHGAQPIKQPAGTFCRTVIKECCKGYEKFSTIKIEYDIPHGIQNGVHYHGTNRIAYLPDNEQGNKVARMLEKAFDAGLIFTIGRSMKTGQDRIAIFNGITHKTKIGGGGMYGYPDANYLDLVESELTQRGVK